MKISIPTPCRLGLAATALATSALAQAPADPHEWLENVTGAEALAWVRQQNDVSQRELESDPGFKGMNERILSILESDARIPTVQKRGAHYYNFWRDARNARGVWRRTSLAEYRQDKPAWETVIDLDALALGEKENWVWKGVTFLKPGYERCLVSLSRGGADAVVIREYDVVKKEFVRDGFYLPEAKSDVSWRDRDTIYVGTDFGPASLTDSGYPRLSKEWKRGQPLAQARVVFEGKQADVAVGTDVYIEPGFRREIVQRYPTFFTYERLLREGERLLPLSMPADADLETWREFMLITLRSDWDVGGTKYPSGALLAITWDKFLAGERKFATLFTPGPRKSLEEISTLRHHVVLNELENVRSRLTVLTPQPDGQWSRANLATPEFGAVHVEAVDDDSDDYWLTVTNFLTPPTLSLGRIGQPRAEVLKSSPAFFNADGLEIAQHEATSKDGTRIPYFIVSLRGLALDGGNPTLLYGYGGFRVSELPGYSGGRGAAWLEKGGVFVLANLRGGGEFGPAWHEAARKENRQRAYDDFIAVAEDLIARKITSPSHLGIMGGSNGGLLVGATFTQRPDLFGAVVCQVPLLDMQRYHRLLAGASWMDEYGDPDKPEEWAYISRYSPYHNVQAGKKYPRVLFTTSTRDDRVHPGHARKMVATMTAQGHDVLYYENIEGGHGGAANSRQQAYMNSLAYTFLWRQLGGPARPERAKAGRQP
jgi:prolyl oligopeptidase